MSNLYISETHVNATEHNMYNDIEPYETWTNDLGSLYKSLQKEYGRCISSVYIDHTDRVKTQRIGWCFQSSAKYDDTKEKYLREVWIRVFVKNEETGKLEYIDMK